MGYGHDFHCEKCNLRFSVTGGVGFLFPQLYQEAIEEGKKGSFGTDIRDFLKEHPEGALDVSSSPYQCRKCGNLTSAPVLSMYLPKDGKLVKKREKGRWSVAFEGKGIDYVAPSELEEDYKCFKVHPHYCDRCGSRMRKLTEKEIKAGIKCPSCGEIMQEGFVLWD